MRSIASLTPRPHQRGSVLILTALTLTVLIGAVGLAVDSGRAYGVKARLNAAIDAASIAAARALSEGATDADRIARAQNVGEKFFWMNYPNDFLSSTASTPVINAERLDNGRWVVDVSATADMPTTFMRVLGRTQYDVAAQGQAIRRDLDVMLVMDTSGSLASPSSVFPTLKNAAKNNFIARFVDGPGGDRVGLVSFASGSIIDVPINKDKIRGFTRTTMLSEINGLSAEGATASAEGLLNGVNELEAIPVDVRSSLRVILFFSDGAPNLINGTFWRKNNTTATGNLYSETSSGTVGSCQGSYGACRIYPRDQRAGTGVYYSNTTSLITHLPQNGSSLGGKTVPLASYDNQRTLTTATGQPGYPYENTRCNVNKAARNMLERIANDARGQDIRIYAIGLGSPLNSLEISFCGYSSKEWGSVILKRLANTVDSDTHKANQPQGLYCHAATASDLDRCFSSIASEILRLTI